MKRERDEEEIGIVSPPSAGPHGSEDGVAGAAANSTTNFRNVSACNRCRTRKNRCDQKLPRCTGCEKARVECVGFDPVSKRTIPRSYVYYLETRVKRLEEKLQASGISFEPPEKDFSISDAIRPGINVPFPVEDDLPQPRSAVQEDTKLALDPILPKSNGGQVLREEVDRLGPTSQQNVSDKKRTARTPSISFARVVFEAVRSTVSHTPSERAAAKSMKQLAGEQANAASSARDSFFGLHARPAVKPAPFPGKSLGTRMVDLYFENANPQIPTLHRGEFMSLFDKVYDKEPQTRTARELYLLNIVFAIGSGIVMESPRTDRAEASKSNGEQPKSKKAKLDEQKYQPEEYHSAAVVHLEGFLDSPPTGLGGCGGLEELQAVCLLAGLALLRPVAPGLWYIIGVAVRLAVDLGLHSEENDADSHENLDDSHDTNFGRRQWTRDLRRRLWWCVYSFDRLVSTCVGRPFGITDQVVTTEFPSLLDDRYITRAGLKQPADRDARPTYKLVAHHYFRLRLLQSEILQVLQHRSAEQARNRGTNQSNSFIHKRLVSPFMGKFDSFQDWRVDVDRRLWEWKKSAPAQQDIGVSFTPLFLELNYWQAVITLYRQSLAVPEQLSELAGAPDSSDVQSPGTINERQEDEQMVLMKVAQAGQTVLKLYRQLHRLKLVNYTYLATHHLFMSGKSSCIAFLHAIWHSDVVRRELTVEDVDFTVLAATSVLDDLIAKCPPAESCRDAFVTMSKATIAMVEKTTGFGSASTLSSQPLNVPQSDSFRGEKHAAERRPPQRQSTNQPPLPQFDMDLRELFSEEEIASRPLAQQFALHTANRRAKARSAVVDHLPAISGAAQYQSQQSSYSSASTTLQQSPPALYGTNSNSGQPQHQRQQSQSQPQTQYQPNYRTTSPTLPSQHYAPLAQTASQSPSQSQSDFPFDFLDTFPTTDFTGQNDGGGWDDFDMNFATGGTGAVGWENGSQWDGTFGGGVDMFDGFFFGEGGNGAANGGGGFG